jgi:hypothetical protein
LRPHFSEKWGTKNRKQHAAFLAEVEDNPQLHREIVEWFLTLPLWLELEEIRAVHACWHPILMRYLTPPLLSGQRLSSDLMAEATREPDTEEEKNSPEPSIFKAAEMLTKGMEIPLPSGYSFKDKYDYERWRVRVRWWDQNATTYRSAAMVEDELRERLTTWTGLHFGVPRSQCRAVRCSFTLVGPACSFSIDGQRAPA